MNEQPHKTGQSQLKGGRANHNFKPEKANRHPEKESPTPTQEKEGPRTQEKEGPINFPRVGRTYLSFFYFTITIMSLSILPKKEEPTPTSSLLHSWVRPGPPLQDRALPLSFLSFWLGPWPSLSPLFSWPSPLEPGQPRPEGPTLSRKGRANLHPRKKANPKLEKEGATPAPNIANIFPKRKAKLHAEKEGAKPQPEKKNQKGRKRLM